MRFVMVVTTTTHLPTCVLTVAATTTTSITTAILLCLTTMSMVEALPLQVLLGLPIFLKNICLVYNLYYGEVKHVSIISETGVVLLMFILKQVGVVYIGFWILNNQSIYRFTYNNI